MSRARPRFGHAHTPCHGRPGPTSASSMNVIGQFGVGFYSVFMVADEVTRLTMTTPTITLLRVALLTVTKPHTFSTVTR